MKMKQKESILKSITRWCEDERALSDAKISANLKRLGYYYSIEEPERVHLGHISVAIREIEKCAEDGAEWKKKLVLDMKKAKLMSQLAYITSGAKPADSYIDGMLSLLDWIDNESIKLGIQLDFSKPELCQEISSYKTGNTGAQSAKGYNKYCIRTSVKDALPGDIFAILAKYGIKYCELDSSEKEILHMTRDDALTIAENAKKYGIEVVSVSSGEGKSGTAYFDMSAFEKTLETAALLGAEYVKVFAFRGNEAGACDCLRKMCKKAKENGIKLLLSNACDTLADTAENCERLLKSVFCSDLDFLFDPTELLLCGEDLKCAYSRLKGYIKTLYISDLPQNEDELEYILTSLYKNGYYADRCSLDCISFSSFFENSADEELVSFIENAEALSKNVYLNEIKLISAAIEKEKRQSIRARKTEFLQSLLKNRKLPPLLPRKEMVEILLREEYGYLPPYPDKMTWKVTKNIIPAFCAGKATVDKVELTSYFDGKKFTFPVYVTLPTAAGKHPFIVLPNFRSDIPDKYFPAEEITDRGFAVLSFDFQTVTSDNDDFTTGLAGVLYGDTKKTSSSPGKFSMWAWAVHRVMDYAETLESLDMTCACVCGHSRLGKTALLAAATDERFQFAFSNDAGSCGDALSRGNKGESVKRIWKYLSFFFCDNFKKYIDDEFTLPFDQHWLAASIAPRHAYIASGEKDIWADPFSQMMCCLATGKAYEEYGKRGFVCEDRFPKVGDVFHEGSVGYHMRDGVHYFSREDWNKFLDFVDGKRR